MPAIQIPLLALWEVERDWTIRSEAGATYGLIGIEDGRTLVCWGTSIYANLPLPIYGVAAILALSFVSLMTLGWFACCSIARELRASKQT